MKFYVGNDHTIYVRGLKLDDGVAINDATVEATLYFRDRSTAIPGITWPIVLTPEGSGGHYKGKLPVSAVITTANHTVVLRVTATTTGNDVSSWDRELVVTWR